MANYTIGQQPCNNYIPQMEANEYATWANVHDCYCGHSKGKRCEGTISFCENCNSDHHSNGYESCQCGGKGKVHGTSQEERKEMSNEKPIGVYDVQRFFDHGLSSNEIMQPTGIPLRDWFAGIVMCGLEMRADYDAGLKTPEKRAHIAYVDADAMLKERSKSK